MASKHFAYVVTLICNRKTLRRFLEGNGHTATEAGIHMQAMECICMDTVRDPTFFVFCKLLHVTQRVHKCSFATKEDVDKFVREQEIQYPHYLDQTDTDPFGSLIFTAAISEWRYNEFYAAIGHWYVALANEHLKETIRRIAANHRHKWNPKLLDYIIKNDLKRYIRCNIKANGLTPFQVITIATWNKADKIRQHEWFHIQKESKEKSTAMQVAVSQALGFV